MHHKRSSYALVSRRTSSAFSITSPHRVFPSWILDVWYPLTFISKPRGEVCYFLVIFAMHASTIVFTVSCLPGALDWLSKTEFPMQAESVNGETWAMIGCMVIQTAVRASISLSSDAINDLFSPTSPWSMRYYHMVNYSTLTRWPP